MKISKTKFILRIIVVINCCLISYICIDENIPCSADLYDEKLRGNQDFSLKQEQEMNELIEKHSPVRKHFIYEAIARYYFKKGNLTKVKHYCYLAFSREITAYFSTLSLTPNLDYNYEKAEETIYDNYRTLNRYYSYCLLSAIQYNDSNLLNLIITDNRFFIFTKIAYEYKKDKAYLWRHYQTVPEGREIKDLILECTFWSLFHQEKLSEALTIGKRILKNECETVFLTKQTLNKLESPLQQ